MLRKLLIICCLFSSGTIFAQPDSHPNPGRGANLRQAPPPPPPMPIPAPGHDNFVPNGVDYKAPGAPLPDFIVRTIDGKNITNKDVQYKGNLIVMIFNPTCSHCEDMTELLEKNIVLFNKTKLLMVATSPMEPYMKDFQEHHHTADYAPIRVGLDSTRMIDRIFMYKMLPQLNIYDKDRKLVKTFYGDTPIDSLKEYIQ